MKQLLLSLFFISSLFPATAQQAIHDEAIINQQERMVFKAWDSDKFTPKAGFLGLNPLYWLTWGLHPDYPKNDLRPLSIFGPQTQRLSLALAMQQTEQAYKLQTDTLSDSFLQEASSYSALIAKADPLWLLYYQKAFRPLIEPQEDPLSSLQDAAKAYLLRTGIYDWYAQERESLQQRLQAARETDMERGSRLMAWYRLLAEYRSLAARWEQVKWRSSQLLELKKRGERIREGISIGKDKAITDIQIADAVVAKSKL